VVENSYDANHISPVDIKTEFAGALGTAALLVGQFVEDLHIQYHDPSPWLLIREGPLTGISSIMPQKRNPSVLERLRGLSSQVVGDSHTVFLMAHNTSTGMSDYRGPQRVVEAARGASQAFDVFGQLVDALIVNPERSLGEVNDDYSTMTEVADTLQRLADVPFRIGHHFASEMTTYGRARGKRPIELTWPELQQIYKEASHGQTLPLTEAQMRQALDPRFVVRNRQGYGGTQPDEVRRMLKAEQGRVGASAGWLETQKTNLQRAGQMLEREFSALIGS
jgi:argininosuccinate lyase